MTSSSQPSDLAPGLWYNTIETRFDAGDAASLINTFDIPSDYEIVLASPSDQPNDPPVDTICFFRDQFVVGLRFPIHPFITEVCNYFRVPLAQLVPNSFYLLCGVVVLFRVHNIPLTPQVFHYFYYPKQSELGTYLF